MKLKKGKFLKEYIPYYDDYDIQPIGAHSVEAKMRSENRQKVYVEYYYVDKYNYKYIVKNPTIQEKLLATTSSIPLKFAGYLTQCTVVDTTLELKEAVQKKYNTVEKLKQKENSKDDSLSL